MSNSGDKNACVMKLKWFPCRKKYVGALSAGLSKADPGPARRARPPPPRFKKIGKVVFVNFDCTTRTYFDFSQHTVFTISILFTTLTTKTYSKCEGASKQIFRPKNILPRRDRAPPVLKFLDPPLLISVQLLKFNFLNRYKESIQQSWSYCFISFVLFIWYKNSCKLIRCC